MGKILVSCCPACSTVQAAVVHHSHRHELCAPYATLVKVLNLSLISLSRTNSGLRRIHFTNNEELKKHIALV